MQSVQSAPVLESKKLETKNITFELTNACNLRCEFCTIWKEREKQILPFKSMIKFLTSDMFNHPLNSITLTGGEAFLYPHLDKLFKSLLALRLKKKIRTIAISSNGYSTEKIVNFLNRNKDYTKDLELFISIDGSHSTHNKLRGREDAYEKTLKTIELVSGNFPEIKLTVKFTIQQENINEIERVYRFCKEKRINILFKLMEKSNASYYHRDYRLQTQPLLKDRVEFDKDSKEKIIGILGCIIDEEKNSKAGVINQKYVNTIIEYLKGDFAINRCFTPRYYIFLTSQGYMYPCLYQKQISILNGNWEQEFRNNDYIELVNNAEQGKCPGCLAYHGYLKYWNFKD